VSSEIWIVDRPSVLHSSSARPTVGGGGCGNRRANVPARGAQGDVVAPERGDDVEAAVSHRNPMRVQREVDER
jgi:hypothetical protein